VSRIFSDAGLMLTCGDEFPLQIPLVSEVFPLDGRLLDECSVSCEAFSMHVSQELTVDNTENITVSLNVHLELDINYTTSWMLWSCVAWYITIAVSLQCIPSSNEYFMPFRMTVRT
jgi:hypothetical protein